MKNKYDWKSEQKAEFLIRLGTLLQQGYTISEGIDFFIKYENNRNKQILSEIHQSLVNGVPFSESLIKLYLPENINGFVFFAENYGDLGKGLIDGGTLYKNNEQHKKKLRKLLRYPIFLLWILIIFMFVMFSYLFPQFTSLFSSLQIDLPFITKLFISIINYLPYGIGLLLFLLLVMVVYFYAFLRKKDPINKVYRLTRLPIFGHLYKIMITYYFCIHLSCLLRNGMSIYDALSVFNEQNKIPFLKAEANSLKSRLEKGESLQEILLSHRYYLQELVFIVDHGQSNGRLPEELEHYASYLLDQFEEKVKTIFIFLQPMLFVCIGFIILLMFSSILVPIFTIIEGI